MRKLKFHEYKLLKKVDFLQWKKEKSLREYGVRKRYRIQNPEDYHKYNKLVGLITSLANKLKQLDPADALRVERTEQLLVKMYDMGLITVKKNLEQCAKLSVSSFCRRRLPVVMVRLRFAENLLEAVSLIEQGHVRIGPTLVRDPALLVTRTMEDFITWSNTSKIKRKILKFNDKLDDFDLLD
uniref:U3 small nucleolar ribonucleoprotein protein IMP3 n=1 Tax=Compsopogon caeruleus TaxID=31354 RepID=A0A7S1TED8_9RHOD|mmetsp:Transcript_3443/g.6465  ORF Transcript_3443/g.6465 Transcript_3443/m.6465 type:complete len:183 (+) Transcript_3443:44-592(+)|eukprot:CAMPEP_0184689732 /NCGR_PEP_ID=MMETSP0312-20130426/30817_1 /TAXON_ID=31354 /ORGANISM="Compsopogon coeruleus, Strain SAG 36.94" /LENGTH=182 /DNA_ID=CAMNT_0027147117 /DNA_START=21 /DNA_END=569 /DNA_ORIENTATION=+